MRNENVPRYRPDTGYTKSSFSEGGGNCVEVKFANECVLIRDSKYTGPADEQPTLPIPAASWPLFLDLILSGESGTLDSGVTIVVHPDRRATITAADVTLDYTPDEWDAFTKGVADGQFAHT
ncbi:DUF397 domain-containing protein [Nocardia terpenica]|uniref:DUF397 domain-containing protein n=1 Tax=Nocardia terpenica TaxID=455432 RepID=A0A164NQK9_9NOCA|nr:DUF397 domain-containing protein [Nocardia terpenica]KZM74612.1 hypothetical protein AWN90_21250 [Nocardia terpenica]NQE93801.1 DUF397 domain-containing protein [Nocardia terpenica]